MIIKYDCKHFPGDRPCEYNKREGQMCEDCPHYATAGKKILVIKLDAVGDVLRTTCILHGLKERYPDSEITWVTRSSAIPVFENNGLVDRVLEFESTQAVLNLMVQEFDLAINLDASSPSAALASAAKAKEKLGFGLDARGKVYPLNPEAIPWFEMGAFDQLKKQNTRSYQDIMLDVCRLKPTKKDIVLTLSDQEVQFAEEFARKHRLAKSKLRIGLNTGASPRWQFKQWTMEGFTGLITLIVRKTDYTVLLYGGPYEAERNARLAAIAPGRVIDTGTDNTLREFFALITLSDVFLTGDTLALHAATALKKRIVALFGPTSEAEIDTYGGQITKVHANLDCLCCYKMRCDFDPNCMNSLTPEHIFSVIQQAAVLKPIHSVARPPAEKSRS